MERELELKLGMYLSTKIAYLISEQVNLITIQHDISYDHGISLARAALELNLEMCPKSLEDYIQR
jgi:hypothetical protein